VEEDKELLVAGVNTMLQIALKLLNKLEAETSWATGVGRQRRESSEGLKAAFVTVFFDWLKIY